MYYKPRIFVSSTFDLIPIRLKIDKIFKETGGEVMLYEKNLTPSTQITTYRKDIQEADFVIFVLDNKYGTKVEDSGLSGTHEEWIIASRSKIPCHVYIKHDNTKEDELKKLINELNKLGVSYYYYKNTNDLLKRMKASVFTIAKEIAINQVDKLKMSRKDILKHSIMFDYAEAISIIKLVESIKRKIKVINLFDTTLFYDVLDRLTYIYDYDFPNFVDNRINVLFKELVFSYNKVTQLHTSIYTNKIGTQKKIYLEELDEEINYNSLSYHGKPGERDKVKENYEAFFEAYDRFKELVEKLKIEIDSL